MAGYESDNTVIHESLTQVQGEMKLFRGNMETILEILQAQRTPASTTANVTHAAGVTNSAADAGTTVKTPTETVVPTTGNRQMVLADSTRLAAAYPWRMPPHFAAHLANEGGFLPSFGSLYFFYCWKHWFPVGCPHYPNSSNDASNPETNQDQVPDDTLDTEDDYRGLHLHFQIPA